MTKELEMADGIEAGGSAFPRPTVFGPGGYAESGVDGVSKRDYFAAHAPPMSKTWWEDCAHEEPGTRWLDADAAWRYAHADAMLRARKDGAT